MTFLAKQHADPRPSTPPHTRLVMYGPIVGTNHSPLGGNCQVDGSKTRACARPCRQDLNPVLHVSCNLVLPAVSLQRVVAQLVATCLNKSVLAGPIGKCDVWQNNTQTPILVLPHIHVQLCMVRLWGLNTVPLAGTVE